jgi:hydrogenase small subunit
MGSDTDSCAFEGLSRREFISYCGVLAAVIGLDQLSVPRIAAALEQAAERPVVVWSDFQECLGCTVALLQSTSPTPAELILQQISLGYHEAAMAPAGFQADESFEDSFDEGAFWVIEGSVAEKIPGAIAIGGRNAGDILREYYPKALGVIAIGSCACFGNVQAAKPDPTGAMGVGEWLRGPGGLSDATVVNLPRCPGQAEDLVATLTYILVTESLPELDGAGRPTFLYGQTVHDNCERRGHFSESRFVEHFGDEGSRLGYCLYKVGCKGPVTFAPCPTTRWNGRTTWCVAAGGPCTGCAEDNFWNDFTPFTEPVPGISLPGIAGAPTQSIGIGIAAVTAVGIGAHFVGQAVTGRLFHGGSKDAPAPEQALAVAEQEGLYPALEDAAPEQRTDAEAEESSPEDDQVTKGSDVG